MNFPSQVYGDNEVLQMFFGDPGTSVIVNKSASKASYDNFMSWLQSKNPGVYNGLKMSRPDLFNAALPSGLGDATTDAAPSMFDKILSGISDALPVYFQASAQRDLIKLNIERAKQGLPPIDQSGISPQVNFGVSSSVQNLLTIAVIGLIGVGLLSVYQRSRSRR